MIIFINGSFGVGKTTVAQQLVSRLPNTLFYDPEEVGSMLRKVLRPIDNPEDYQDLPLWRTMTVTTAQQLRAAYGRDLVIPMTVWHPPYFAEIMQGLRGIDPQLFHFCLIASEQVIYHRLDRREREEQLIPDFAREHVARCAAAV